MAHKSGVSPDHVLNCRDLKAMATHLEATAEPSHSLVVTSHAGGLPGIQ
jgi:hypothetical protein